jgi:hypothetical protein
MTAIIELLRSHRPTDEIAGHVGPDLDDGATELEQATGSTLEEAVRAWNSATGHLRLSAERLEGDALTPVDRLRSVWCFPDWTNQTSFTSSTSLKPWAGRFASFLYCGLQ